MMTEFKRYTKKTRRAMFLEEMEQVVPMWGKLCGLIEPHYPKPGNGRRPKELEKMLRIYFLQQWFNLADPAVEEALYDSATLRQFVGIDFELHRCRMRRRCASSGTCWKTTILGEEISGDGEPAFAGQGRADHDGHDCGRDHHSRAQFDQKPRAGGRPRNAPDEERGRNWYFGMKAHVGVDSQTKIIHTAVATAANVSDMAHVAGPAAWRRNAGVGRRSVSRAKPR